MAVQSDGAGTRAGAFLASILAIGVFVVGMDRNRGEQLRSLQDLQDERARHWTDELATVNAEILRIRQWKDRLEQDFPTEVGVLDQRVIAIKDRVTKLEALVCPPSITSGS